MTDRRPPTRRGYEGVTGTLDATHRDWPWLRPTLTFLLGLLLGTIVIAATRPLPAVDATRAGTPAASPCEQLAADSERLAALATQIRDAARRHDSAGLMGVRPDVTDVEDHIAAELSSWH